MTLLLRTDRTQAYMLKDILAMNGIIAHVFNEHMSSIVGDVPPEVALPQVWLDDDADQARAMAVLRDYYIRRNRTGVLFCPACREENPATFEICWKCGAAIY
jgi:Putative prokaryotic signal transducing protein